MKKIKTVFLVLFLMAAACLLIVAGTCPVYAAGPLYLDRAAIDHDTTWSGTVILRGQNVVKKGATLTVLPGTLVKFVWSDEDGDGIGDGELNIEGRITARGTRDDMITFTSAQPVPRMKDWTYIMLSHAAESVIAYCRVEYAFTAVQVHWTKATIKDNIITHNFEGMRFSTADVDVLHNKISENSFGIRYETRGSAATIKDNNITRNGCGFFAVVKCAGGAAIRGNNIENEEYNVKLGSQQREDLDYGGNWWGSADPAAAEASIFDKTKDDTLGRVTSEPCLSAPVEGAGVE